MPRGGFGSVFMLERFVTSEHRTASIGGANRSIHSLCIKAFARRQPAARALRRGRAEYQSVFMFRRSSSPSHQVMDARQTG